MRLLISMILTAGVIGISFPVFAGNIKCQGKIFQDGTPEPLMISTVRETCGKPDSQEVGVDIYNRPNGVKIMIRYNNLKQVQTIEGALEKDTSGNVPEVIKKDSSDKDK